MTPTRMAYQRFAPAAADAIDWETIPARPSVFAASTGESPTASAAMPSPATRTSPNGSSQRKNRYASAPPMIPPPTSTSRATASKAASRVL